MTVPVVSWFSTAHPFPPSKERAFLWKSAVLENLPASQERTVHIAESSILEELWHQMEVRGEKDDVSIVQDAPCKNMEPSRRPVSREGRGPHESPLKKHQAAESKNIFLEPALCACALTED